MRRNSNIVRLLAGIIFLLALVALGLYGGTVSGTQRPDHPPTKQAFLDQVEATEVAAMTAIPPGSKDIKDVVRPTPAPGNLPLGIIESGQAPLPSSLYKIENKWRGQLGSNYVTLYAGSLTEDPTQGVVFMQIMTKDLKQVPGGGPFLTPAKAGPVRVIAAKGMHVSLGTRGSSQTFDFDVGTGRFISR